MKKNVMVSACLIGTTCRWHGRKVKSGALAKILQSMGDVNIIPVCPEMEGGLPCPRSPVKRVRGRVFETCAEKENRKNVTGKELTSFFIKGAELALNKAKENKVEEAILCKYSPSCDKSGFTGKMLLANGIEVLNTF